MQMEVAGRATGAAAKVGMGGDVQGQARLPGEGRPVQPCILNVLKYNWRGRACAAAELKAFSVPGYNSCCFASPF